MNRITVCATAGDSVALPPAVGGQEIVVLNAGTGACQVFADASTSDTINGVAAGTGVSLATATAATFYAFAPGTWAWVKSSLIFAGAGDAPLVTEPACGCRAEVVRQLCLIQLVKSPH